MGFDMIYIKKIILSHGSKLMSIYVRSIFNKNRFKNNHLVGEPVVRAWN